MNKSINNNKIVPFRACFKHLVGNSNPPDFLFIIEEDNANIPAHKYILAPSSRVFEGIVHGSGILSPADFLRVDNISAEAFIEILCYIYTGKINLEYDNVIDISNQSDYFGLTVIAEKCLECLDNLNASDLIKIYHQLFRKFPSSKLLVRCTSYIQILTPQFLASNNFERITVDEFKPILQMDQINCTEVDLFEAVIKLSKVHCIADGLELTGVNQRSVLKGIENLLRFESMTESEFETCLAIQRDFFSSNEIKSFRNKIRHNDTSKKARRQLYPTYRDAVWIPIVREKLLRIHPSAFITKNSLGFIFRCSKGKDKTQMVASSIDELTSGDPSALAKIEVLCGSGYEWRESVNGEVPIGSVEISQNYFEPTFIARSSQTLVIGPVNMNCNMLPLEFLVATEIIQPYNHQVKGAPSDAVLIGKTKDDMNIYLGRAWYAGNLYPAIVIFELGSFVAHNSTETWGQNYERRHVIEYEFLRMKRDTYKWEKLDGTSVPVNAVVGGYTKGGEILYYGRKYLHRHHDKYFYGPIQPSKSSIYLEMDHSIAMHNIFDEESKAEFLVKIENVMS